ncbi:hypothetical protein HZB06_03310 [Candidatus Wolfebacteria bacterium]|nr:hypothetical protein [Candidatus Wolfebacteria bacterium]
MIENIPLENSKNDGIEKISEITERDKNNEGAPELSAAFAEETIKLLDSETNLFIDETEKEIKAADKQGDLIVGENTEKSLFTAKLNELQKEASSLFGEIKEKIFSFFPIKKEVFSPFAPEKELKKIKEAPKEERPRLLSEFKEQWRQQKEGLAKIQESMINLIRENPDTPIGKLYKETMGIAEPHRLSPEQKEQIVSILLIYSEKHREVKKIRQKYPNDADLYAAVFGKQPEGKIEAVEGPMTLFFRAYNINDYTRIYTQTFQKNQKLTLKDVFAARLTSGVSTGTSSIEGLEGTIIAQNATEEDMHTNPMDARLEKERVLAHEEQHAIKRLFPENINNQELCELDEEMLDLTFSGSDETEMEMEKHIKRSFRRDRERMEESAKDEILAYSKEKNYGPKKNFYALTKDQKDGGLYDYFNIANTQRWVDFLSRLFPQHEALIKKTAENVYKTEYRRLIKDGIDALTKLEENGRSKEEIIALLINEPLAKWKKVVKRLLEK